MSIINKFNIPVSWQQVTVEQFVELNTIDVKELGVIGLQLERFCILANLSIDDDEIEDMCIDDMDELYKSLYFLNRPPNINTKQIVGNDYRLIDINKISIGEFIDVDSFLQDDNLYINFTSILSILYRKYKTDEFDNIHYQPYTFDLNSTKDYFDNLCIYDCYNAVQEVINFRELILNTYSAIFSSDNLGDDLTEEEKEGLGEEEVEEIKRDLEKEKSKNKFAWPWMIYNLAGEDLLKMREILKLPLTYVLNIIIMNITMNQQ